MSSINGIWGNNTSYLFGSSNTSGSSASNILGIDLGEYYSITKGTYSRLLKAYYKKYGTEKSNSSSETKKKEDTTTTKTTLKTNANDLSKAAGALVTTGKDSVFNKVDIKDDNTLSIDEETFKAADMTTVKTLFNGAGSFGAKIQSAASIIYMNVNDSFGSSSTYTSSGNFGNYSTGNILDSFL